MCVHVYGCACVSICVWMHTVHVGIGVRTCACVRVHVCAHRRTCVHV